MSQVTHVAEYDWIIDEIITQDNFLDFIHRRASVEYIVAGLFKVLFAPSTFEIASYK